MHPDKHVSAIKVEKCCAPLMRGIVLHSPRCRGDMLSIVAAGEVGPIIIRLRGTELTDGQLVWEREP